MRVLLMVILLAGATAIPSFAWAQTYRAGAGCTYATIQNAVDAIPSNGSGTIRARNQTFSESVSVANKTVTLIGGHDSCADTSPSGVSDLNAGGTGSPALSLFVSSGPHTLRVERFDLQGGTGVVAPFVPYPGGGLNVWTAAGESSSLIVDNVWIYSNTTEYTGGGIALHGDGSGIATLRNNTRIFSNQATGDDAFGGGLYCSGDYAMVMRGGTINNNTAGSASDLNGRGGGLYLDGCTMSWFAHPGVLMAASASLDGNTAHGYGGGLYATGGASVFLRGAHDSGTPTSTGPFLIHDNDAINDGSFGVIGFGGAIYATGSGTSVVADRTWIYNHEVPRNGGALFVSDGAEVTVERSAEVCHNPRNCSRLFNNGAPTGVGGAVYARDAGSKVTIRRTRLSDNTRFPFYINEGSTLEITDSLIHGDVESDYAFTAWASTSTAPTPTIRIRRSTLADLTPNFAVFRLVNNPANLILFDSIVHETSPISIVTVSGSPSTSFDCVLWHQAPSGIATSRTLVDDPQFVDRGNDNYYLAEGSRAINYCDTVPPAPGVDLDWNPRGITQSDPSPLYGAYDIGAYEVENRLFSDRFQN